MQHRFHKMLLASVTAITLLSAAAMASPASANTSIEWRKTTAETEANDLHDIVKNNEGTAVSVGDDGTIVASADRAVWQQAHTSTSENLHSVATDGTRFAAVGEHGTVAFSNNGYDWVNGYIYVPFTLGNFYTAAQIDKYYRGLSIDWGTQLTQRNVELTDVTWDGSKFVAVGKLTYKTKSNSTMLTRFVVCTSTDGLQWSTQLMGVEPEIGKLSDKFKFPQQLQQVLWTGSEYVVIGDSLVFTSPDTVNWTLHDPGIRGDIADVAYNGKVFVAVGWDGRLGMGGDKARFTGIIYTSTDARTWTELTTGADFGVVDKKWAQQNLDYNGFAYIDFNTVLWDGTKFVAGANFGMVLQSRNGVDWSLANPTPRVSFNPMMYVKYSGLNADLQKLLWDGTSYIAVGNNGTILSSAKLDTWKVIDQRQAADFDQMATDGGSRYVATGFDGALWESGNGYQWSPVKIDGVTSRFHWSGLAAMNGVILASGYGMGDDNEYYYYSPKPGVWELKKFPAGLRGLLQPYVIQNQFYVAGIEGYITSTDGLTWSGIRQKTTPIKRYIVGNVVLGTNDKQLEQDILMWSYDGTDWHKTITGPHHYEVRVSNMIWTGSSFAVLGATGLENSALVSSDGLSWDSAEADPFMNHFGYNGEMFVGTGRDGRLFQSFDGLHYAELPSVTNRDLGAPVWDGEKWLAPGKGGTILVGVPSDVIRVKVDGTYLKMKQAGLLVDDHSMLPVRDLFEAVGAEVVWDEATQTATGKKDGHVVRFTVNQPTAQVDGKTVTLDAPAQIIRDKTMAPGRFVAEVFGCTVDWDNETRTFIVTTK